MQQRELPGYLAGGSITITIGDTITDKIFFTITQGDQEKAWFQFNCQTVKYLN